MIKPLTSLRFFAAAMVVSHHYWGFAAGFAGVLSSRRDIVRRGSAAQRQHPLGQHVPVLRTAQCRACDPSGHAKGFGQCRDDHRRCKSAGRASAIGTGGRLVGIAICILCRLANRRQRPDAAHASHSQIAGIQSRHQRAKHQRRNGRAQNRDRLLRNIRYRLSCQPLQWREFSRTGRMGQSRHPIAEHDQQHETV